MAVDYFVTLLRQKYEALDAASRKKAVRELVAESPENAAFLRKHFPDFFAEAFAAPASTAHRKRRKSR